MSEGEVPPAPEPDPAPPEPLPPEQDPVEAELAEASGAEAPPALDRAPGWVPVAVVAGVVLVVEGFIVGRIAPAGGPDSPGGFVRGFAQVSIIFGLLALAVGYFAYLLARVDLARAFEAFFLSAVTVLLYASVWPVLFAVLSGSAADLFFIREISALSGLATKVQMLVSVGVLLSCVALFAVAFQWTARIAWPHFRAGVALNVLAMLHGVLLLVGVVSALNLKFSPRYLGSGLDLTETREYSLSERTKAVLDTVKGDLRIVLLDFGRSRGTPRGLTSRTSDLLREYLAHCPAVTYQELEPLRRAEETETVLRGLGADPSVLREMASREEEDGAPQDLVLFAYREKEGDKAPPRTRWLRVDQEFSETSSLGTQRFKGESILTSAIHEVVFTQRRVYVVLGHGELEVGRTESRSRSLGQIVEALKRDNYAVETLDLVRSPSIPADADVVFVAGPRAPFQAAEAEALRNYLAKGRALVLLLDVPDGEPRPIGLEDLFASYGVDPKRDHRVITFLSQQVALLGGQAIVKPSDRIGCSREEFGSAEAAQSLKRTNFVVAFDLALPVMKAEKPPEGVEVREIAYAPREVLGQYKSFAARWAPGRKDFFTPAPGDLVDRRLPLGLAAERKVVGASGGGRLVVFGDADFATDGMLGFYPANATLLMNSFSWAVRREPIGIDPKTVETEYVSLKDADRDLAFWTTVVGLPVLALGIAVGVWWSRRR